MTATLPKPVAIFGHPDEDPWQVLALADHSVAQQLAPLVLHPEVQPWLARVDGTMHPAADPTTRTMLGMVARHSGGHLWLILRDGETRDPWPRWVLGAVRCWQATAGRMPSRIRSATWAGWKVRPRDEFDES